MPLLFRIVFFNADNEMLFWSFITLHFLNITLHFLYFPHVMKSIKSTKFNKYDATGLNFVPILKQIQPYQHFPD